jgi:hypothetical protein
MTDAMKMALFHIYTLGDEMGELIIEKQCVPFPVFLRRGRQLTSYGCARTLEKATEREGPLKEKAHSIHIARKALYTRVRPPSPLVRSYLTPEFADCQSVARRSHADEPALEGGLADEEEGRQGEGTRCLGLRSTFCCQLCVTV